MYLLLILLANIVLVNNCDGQSIDDGIVLKCCPEDEGLIRYGSQLDYTYGCISLQDRNESFNLNILQPLRIGKKNATVFYGFPDDCLNGTYSETQLSDGVPEHYCIDKLLATDNSSEHVTSGSGSVIVVKCNKNPGQNTLSLRTVAKCCPENMIYDVDRHVCIRGSGNEFEEFVMEETLLLDVRFGLQEQCKYPNVVYDYSNYDYTFNLTDDVLLLEDPFNNTSLESRSFCLDDSNKNMLIARVCRDRCDVGPCVTKCCPDGYVFKYFPNCTRAVCAPSDTGLSFTFYDLSGNAPVPVEATGAVGIRHELVCPMGKFRETHEFPRGATYLDVVSGDMYVPSYAQPMQKSYCLEVIENSCGVNETTSEMNLFICFPVTDPQTVKINQKYQVYSYGLVISCVFLLATLLVYLALPQLRNLHGKTIMCHVIAMLIAYSCLARIGWSYSPPPLCRALGFILYFGFVAAFSWLNIMCFDIWYTFGNIKTIQGIRKDKELKKFLMFSLYAWGLPIILTVATYLFDEYNYPTWLNAEMGDSQCWFSTKLNGTPWIILFIIPVGIQITLNCILFVLTAIHCNKIKSEIHRMQAGSMGERRKRRFMADRAKYSMNIKLFIVMGITWVLEIVSSLVTSPIEMWYIADILNILQGIFIFCILVLKPKVFMLIKKRLGIKQVDQRIRSDGTMTSTVNNSVELSSRKISTATTALIR